MSHTNRCVEHSAFLFFCLLIFRLSCYACGHDDSPTIRRSTCQADAAGGHSAHGQYLNDGHLPLDNNHSERMIRPLTVGRKNWMFLGSTLAAPGRMKLFSIVSSAKRHCLSLQDYLEDIFLKLSQAAQHRPGDLVLAHRCC